MQTDEFINAITTGDLSKVNQLIEGSPTLAGTRDKDGVSAVLFALYRGQKQIAAAIAAKKLELDIFESASLGNLSHVKSLVTHDHSLVNPYSPDGFTAMALAAYLGQKETMEYLLENGADVNAMAKNATGYTALTGAVSQNHTEITRVLVKKGANVNHRYEGGFTPLMHAAYAGNVDLVNFLLENGADPNAKTSEGKTPMTFAREKGHGQVVGMLKSHGAS